MQIKELKKDGLKHEMEVTLTAADIDTRVEGRLKEVAKSIRLPGFRPGKAPMKIMKQKYGKAVMGEVLEIAVNESTAKALQERKLKPAMQPKVEVKSFDEGKDLVFTMAVEVLPEFKIKDFKGMKLKKLVAKPTDKDINDAMEKIAANNKQTKPIEGKRAAKKGDTVVFDFHGRTADDNKAHEGMHAHGHGLELGSGTFIPGFEDQLIGAQAGEKVEVRVTFPKDYGAKDLAGREAIFDCEIHEIRETVEGTIDEDFAKSLGLENLDALKKAIADQLQHEFDHQTRLYLKKGLMDKLDADNAFAVPQGMLDAEFENIVRQVERDPHREGKGKLTDDEKVEFKDIAERRVRLGLILSEIGTENKITVSDQELQRAVIAEASKFRGQERQVFDFYSKNRQALEGLRAPLFEEKVVDYILELAELTEKEVSPDELMNAIEAEEEAADKKKPAAKKAEGKKDEKPKAKKK